MNKTKFFSSLLVAVLFATTSVFVSCKDYDDDIKNLQSQIDKAALKADLDALSTKLAGVESTANAAKTTAENALAKANANATEIAAVKATAEKAAKDAAEGLVAVAKAQNTADAAAAAAAAAQKTADDAAAAAKAELAAAKKELDDAIEKLQKAVENLDAVKATKVELADAKTELKAYTDAAKEAALAAAKLAADAAAAAQSTADAATAAAGKAQSTADQNAETIKTLATQTALETLSTELKDEIEGLKTTLAGITGVEEMAELVEIIGNFDTIVEKLFSAVTSVEIIASYSGHPDATNETISFPLGTLINGSGNANSWYKLDFVFGKQKWTDKFGDKEDRFEDADQIIEYTEGKDIRAKQALLVRVNPVNATFAKEDVKLIDSKGRNLDELIVIGDPYRYDGLITRGATTETGLWVIPVSVKENTTLKDFNLITFNEREYFATEEEAKKFAEENNVTVDFETTPKDEGRAIAYAVAINNTADEADGRFVASTYDLSAEYVYFTPEDVLNFNLKAKDSKGMPYYATSGYVNNDEADYNYVKVHNRWKEDVYNREGGVPGIQSKDQTTAYTLLNPEQAWSLSADAEDAGWVAPASVAKKSKNDDDKVYDTQNDGDDYRYWENFFTIKSVGQKITVSLPPYLKKKAEYWYITYDFKANAVESNPSEWEAWQSYKSEIKGIYTMTRGAEDIDLVINKAEAQGDVIGFRVFAVNYDGSLLDPDGKAFYVKVGEEPEPKTLTIKAEFMAVNAEADMEESYTNDEDKTYTAAKGFNVSTITAVSGNEFESLQLSGSQGYFNVYSYENEGKVRNNAYVYYSLLKSDKKTLATNFKDVAFIKVGVAGEDLTDIVDGAELLVGQIDGKRNDANKKEKYRIVIKATKKMPDAAWTYANHFDKLFSMKSDYNPATGVMTVYPKPITSASKVLAPAQLTEGSSKVFYWNVDGSTAKNLWGSLGTIKWNAAAASDAVSNAGMRFIKDYIASVADGVDVDNYHFDVSGLPTGIKTPGTATYTSVWANAAGTATPDIASNTAVSVIPQAVVDEKTYPLNLIYTYKNVSLTQKSASPLVWNSTYDLAVPAWTCNADFKDAVDLLSYTNEYDALLYTEFDAQGNKIADKTETDNKLYIAWVNDVKALAANDEFTQIYKAKYRNFKNSTTFNRSTFVNKKYEAVTDLTGLFATTISSGDRVLAQDAGLVYDTDIKVFNPALFNFDNPATDKVEKLTIELTGNITTYIKVKDGSTTNALTFVKTGYNNLANPTEDIDGKLKISGYDAYGKPHSYTIDVVILHADDAVE